MNALRKKMRLIGPCVLPILLVAAMVASTQVALAGTTNSTLTNFYDNFETYTNGTPLIDGTNGWYGSSSNIIVQINTVRTGTNAAMIPVDCTLSNRFETNAPSTNIWLQMDLRAVFYDGTNPPVVDTNMAAMFYINSNGYFMVHNGPANPSPTNSLSWVMATNNVQISTNGTNWVRINIYEDFSQTNWDLYSDGVLVTNTIGFINTNLTNFAGFDIYNGAMTSYLDNVSVAAMNTNQFPVIVIPPALATNVFAGKTAGGKTFNVRNVWVTAVDYKVQTNQSWVTASPVVGPVAAYATNTVTLTFADTENWAAGAYNAVVSVVATNTDDGEYDTQTVAVVINIMNMQVSPTSLSNSSYVGLAPTSQSFQVINAGAGSFNYTGAITNDWILSCTPSNGTVEAFATNLITVTYSNSITNWAVDATSNTTITIASTNGGGATQTVSVALNVVKRNQTITFPAISDQITTNTVGLSATASSSLPATNFVVISGPGVLDGTNLTFANSGSVSITASQPGDGTWNPAPNVTNTFNVTKAIASVTLNNLNQTYDGTARTVTTTTVPGGLTVNITYAGNAWAPTNVGSYAMSGTVNEPMYQGFQVGTLVVTNKALSLVGMTASNKVYDGNTTATISSYGTTNGIVGIDDVALDYSSASAAFDTANVGVGKTVTLSSLALSGAAAGNYSIANQTTTADITIVTNNTITFPAIPAQPFTNGTLTLSASASSGLTVTFTNISGPGTIAGDVITFTGVGEIAVTAVQTGNMNYAAAVSVTNTFPVYGFSPTTNSIPWSDNFENYFNIEPLINGTNGWYGSATDIIVQDSIFFSGAKAAKIPLDCTLSNRFLTNVPSTNICLQMDVRPSFYDSTNPPVVDTNATWMFYINTNGKFVVHNGPTTNAAASTNWVTLTNTPVVSNAWVRVLLYQDYANTNCSLYVNHVLLTNNIGFINTNITNFAGFDLYSGSSTTYTYLDNVLVEAPGTVLVNPTDLTNSVMKGLTESNQFTLTAQTGTWTFVNTTSDAWLAVSPVAGSVAAAGTNIVVWCDAETNSVGSYTGAVYVSAINSNGLLQTQTVAVTMDVMDLQVAPTYLTNQVWVGAQPTSQTFEVWNAGAGSFQYATQTEVFWIACSSNAGTLGAYSTNVLTLTYANTAGWAAGMSNTSVKVWSTDGGGATQFVYVTLYVNDLTNNMQVLPPTNLTNSVMAGLIPTNQQSFTLTNAGDGLFRYTVTNAAWLAATSTNGALTSHSNVVIAVNYDSNTTVALPPDRYTNTIAVTSTNGSGATQNVDVVLNVMGLDVNPTNFSNTVMVGWAPAPQTGQVINLGPAAFGYTVTVTNNWLSCAPTSITVNAYSTNTFVVTYSNTVGWTTNTTSNTTILIYSPEGGGTNRTVDVALTVVGRATNFYVSMNGLSIGPYTNWATAATNIQDAVNAATSVGDRVLVSNGVFTLTNQVSVTNGMFIEGVYGRSNTFINGNYPVTTNRCFYVATNASVQGLTISNGCAEFGGGVYLTAGATLRDCEILRNRVTASVFVGFGGGGIFADSFSTVTNCVIAGNTSAELAGGLLLDSGSTAFNCQISNNAATNDGGGIVVWDGSAIWYSTITGNRASAAGAQGGGVMLGENTNDTSTVWNCTLVNNSAAIGGGLAAASGRARNCLVRMNSAGIAGAGVYMADSSDATIQNCTISSNSPNYGVYSPLAAGGYFDNCVIVSNAILVIFGAPIGFTNNCVESTNGLSGTGNITNDPAFLDFTNNNFRLSSVSPCRNAGTNQAWMIGATDLDGNPRIMGTSVDMGAYEVSMSWTLAPGTLTNQVMIGLQPTNQGFAIINYGSNTLYYTVTNTAWLSATSTNGTLGSYTNNAIAVMFSSSITNWPAGFSNSTVNVVVTNDVSLPQTQTVNVIMNIMQMQAAPTHLTNNVMNGLASTQTFNVADIGKGLLTYTISTNAYDWVSVNPVGGVLTNEFTNTITVSYAASLSNGVKTGLLTVASSSGGGATQYVALTMNVIDLLADPGGLTNVVLVGYTPTNQSFTLVNPGTALLTYTLATNAPWVSCFDPAGGALTGPGTNTITVSYGPTTNWTPGTISNATVTIVSTNGGGATQTVAIVLNVNVTELLPPSVVTASKGAYADKVRVTWDVVTNATGYQVWRNTANITATATNLGAIADTLYDDITAVPEVTYYYWVKSTNSLEVSAFSMPDTGYYNLYAPVGLTASKGTHTDKVALSWTAAAGAVGYEIWRNTSSAMSTAQKISSPDVTGTSYADTGATNAVLYTYWVKTKGASGAASAFSASDTGWRGLLSPSVSASKGLPREVSVTWSVSAGATSYELWKNTVNESSSATLLAGGSATLYRDIAVIPGSHYYYWVKALCAQGDSGLGTSSEGWCGAAKWDFNGDGRAEAWYYHEGDGRWYVMMTTNMLSTLDLGGAGWDAVPADYDGDGKTDPAVYNRGDPSTGSGLGGTWQFMLSGNGYELVTASNFGGAGYAAAVGDYDGDGIADPAIYAQASGTWQAALSGNGYQAEGGSGFGSPGYQAVPADYDGDGKTDPAIYEEASGNWLMALSGNDYNVSYVLEFGLGGFAPVPGEYGGLGYAQIAVYHEASGNWYIRTGDGLGEYTTVNFGQPGDLPMPADYDGDRYEEECVFYRDRYDGIWYQLRSTEGYKMISGRMSRP